MASTEQDTKPRRKLLAMPPAMTRTARRRRTFSIEYDLDKCVFEEAQETNAAYSDLVESALRDKYGHKVRKTANG